MDSLCDVGVLGWMLSEGVGSGMWEWSWWVFGIVKKIIDIDRFVVIMMWIVFVMLGFWVGMTSEESWVGFGMWEWSWWVISIDEKIVDIDLIIIGIIMWIRLSTLTPTLQRLFT